MGIAGGGVYVASVVPMGVCVCCDPAMDWANHPGWTQASPNSAWDWLQQPWDPIGDLAGLDDNEWRK